jgi:hypothetical protein
MSRITHPLSLLSLSLSLSLSLHWLMLFKEIIAVYSEIRTKFINTKYNFTDC